VYFGAGQITSIYEDTEEVGAYYAEISKYKMFENPVDFYRGPSGNSWENAKTMRNSVRRLPAAVFEEILAAGGISFADLEQKLPENSLSDSLRKEISSLPGPGRRSNPIKRKIRRILETYERPSKITNMVKRQRNYICQICAQPGFVKRDGSPYCEVHHMLHLADDPPAECFGEEFLAVLCANCHRRMHYGKISNLTMVEKGWNVRVDGEDVFIQTIYD
jgi:hypothetical protein